MIAQEQKGICPGCGEQRKLLIESDGTIGCDACEGMWGME